MTKKFGKNKGRNNSDFLQNWFPPEIRSTLFNLYKFQNSEKTITEWCRMHWNVLNDEKLVSMKNWNTEAGDQKIQTLWKIGSTKKLDTPF